MLFLLFRVRWHTFSQRLSRQRRLKILVRTKESSKKIRIEKMILDLVYIKTNRIFLETLVELTLEINLKCV